jgi:hypothetical protein
MAWHPDEFYEIYQMVQTFLKYLKFVFHKSKVVDNTSIF